MSPALRIAMTVTDVIFIAYCALAALDAAGIIAIPESLLYAHAHDPRVKAWNWSFFPLDLAFSLTGLAAVRAARRREAIWRPLALVSLALTMVAGGMAVGYWTLLREFDLAWFGPNLLLLAWPLFFLPKLIRDAPGAPQI